MGSFWPVPLLGFVVSYDLIKDCDFLAVGSNPPASSLRSENEDCHVGVPIRDEDGHSVFY